MAQVCIRLDDQLKKDVEETCRDLGINLTTAFTLFAAKVARERRIPFDVTLDPFDDARNQEALGRSMAELKMGRIVEKTLDELDAMAHD